MPQAGSFYRFRILYTSIEAVCNWSIFFSLREAFSRPELPDELVRDVPSLKRVEAVKPGRPAVFEPREACDACSIRTEHTG